MTAWAYYNENDAFAAEWLRNLINAGHIAPGHVDQRSIIEVEPADLAGFTQCHFFAGIGVWSYALRLAGWPDDRPVWTGSCPCQPFSGAGKRRGRADERHLWPDWFRLISERRPATIFGEQVASRDALDWFDHVSADLEGAGYACGAADLCVAGVGGPHWRQRLWFVAHATREREHGRGTGIAYRSAEPANGGRLGDMVDTDGRNASPARLQRGGEHGHQPQDGGARPLANAECGQLPQSIGRAQGRDGQRSDCASPGHDPERPGPVNGFWRNADWLLCTDGKWRPVEPGTQPLAHRVAGRVGQLRAYGNAICPEVAKVFIEAAKDIIE